MLVAHALAPAALALLLFYVACETAQQLGFKVGAVKAGEAANRVTGVLLQPLIWLGVALWFVESVAWVLALQKAPLSVAYSVMTLGYATVPLASVLILKERLSRRQVAGAALIFAGVACVAFSGAAA